MAGAGGEPAPGTPRPPPGALLFTTYNLLDLGAGGPATAEGHYRDVIASIMALRTDVLAVQEIRGADVAAAQGWLRRLADDTGMSCLVPDGPGGGSRGGGATPALAPGSHGYHTGLLWRPGIEPVPASLRARGKDLWHSLVWVVLDTGSGPVRHASYHAPPFGRRMRAEESELVLAALGGPGGRIPTLVGADWNGESADRVPSGDEGWRLYEPADSFAGVEWFADMVYQCEWDYDDQGRRRHRVDRRAGDVLWAGGLHDAAAVLRAPWQPTSGHYPGDRYGQRGIRRRIDAIRVTTEVVPALSGYHVTSTGLAQRASDHLPVTVTYHPSAIATPPGGGRGG